MYPWLFYLDNNSITAQYSGYRYRRLVLVQMTYHCEINNISVYFCDFFRFQARSVATIFERRHAAQASVSTSAAEVHQYTQLVEGRTDGTWTCIDRPTAAKVRIIVC